MYNYLFINNALISNALTQETKYISMLTCTKTELSLLYNDTQAFLIIVTDCLGTGIKGYNALQPGNEVINTPQDHNYAVIHIPKGE